MPPSQRRARDSDERPGLPAVNPVWPLLATMLGGVWMGSTWFALNAIALGGERKVRQFVAIGVGLAGAFGLALFFGVLVFRETISKESLEYGLILVTGWKLAIAYLLFQWQRREFQLYEYYVGPTRNGLYVALAGLFLRGIVIGAIPEGILQVVLS